MATTVVATRNPLLSSPFVDPDESAYGEVPVEKQLELRVANATPGAGALVEARNSTTQIAENERVGEQVAAHTATTEPGGGAAVNDANVAVAAYSATNPTGYAAASSLEVQALAASATDRGTRIPFAAAKNLTVYSGGALFAVHRRCTSNTNLTRIQIRFYFATASDWAAFELFPAAGTINTWAELTVAKGATPVATSGTVNWANVTAVGYFFDVSAAYTGNLEVRDLRLGTVQTAATSPTGHLAWESSYDWRVRYRDAASPTSTFGPWSSWGTFKVSQPPVVTQTAPGAGAAITDPTPDFTWTYSSPGAKAQVGAQVALFEVVAGQDQLVDTYSLTGAGTTITQPPFILGTGKTYAWTVTATDTDGLATTSTRRTFTTTFSQPATPTGLTVTTDVDSSSATLAWTGPLGALYAWRVYRRQSGGAIVRISANGATWEDGDAPITSPSLIDYHVPEGVQVEYLLSAHSGSASSEGESATTSATGQLIAGRWVNVIPGAQDRTFELIPTAMTETPDLQLEETEVIDRPTIHVSRGRLLEPRLSFALFVALEDIETIARLRAISADPTLEYAILKSPTGEVWRVQYGTIPRTYGAGGNSTAAITATVVAQ